MDRGKLIVSATVVFLALVCTGTRAGAMAVTLRITEADEIFVKLGVHEYRARQWAQRLCPFL